MLRSSENLREQIKESRGSLKKTILPLENGKIEFIQLSAVDVASQLTEIESEMFQKLKEKELYHVSWKDEKARKKWHPMSPI